MGPTVVEKPTVVLVHGAFHTPDCWDLVTAQLRQYQYPFRTVKLLSAGGNLATTVADDAAEIRKTTSELVASGKDVILVLHSYSGIPGTESAKGLLKKDLEAEQKLGGITSLVYISAFLIPTGDSVASFLGGMPPWIVFDVSNFGSQPKVVKSKCCTTQLFTDESLGRKNDSCYGRPCLL